jgi:hypothetical protein
VALFSGGVLGRVACHYADEAMGWSSRKCPSSVESEESLLPKYREIMSHIWDPPDSTTWSEGLGQRFM